MCRIWAEKGTGNREAPKDESGSSAVLVEIKKMAEYFTRFAMKKEPNYALKQIDGRQLLFEEKLKKAKKTILLYPEFAEKQ